MGALAEELAAPRLGSHRRADPLPAHTHTRSRRKEDKRGTTEFGSVCPLVRGRGYFSMLPPGLKRRRLF